MLKGSRLFIILRSYWLLAKWDWRISKQAFQKWKPYLDTDQQIKEHSNRFDAYPIQDYLHVSRLFDKAVRHHYRPMNCLRRCLALQELLLSLNMPSKLHIGVKFGSGDADFDSNANSRLQAHSWLSINGHMINDSKEVVDSYQEITSNSEFFTGSIQSL